MPKFKRLSQFLHSGFSCIKIFFEAEPRDTLIYIVSTIAYALAWVLQTISLQYFFDAINGYGDGKNNFSTVIMTFLTMGLVYLFYHIFDGVNNCLPEIFELKLKKHLNQRLFRKVGQLRTIDFEDTARLEFMEKAISGGGKLVWVGFALVDIIFYYLAYFIFVSWYLFTLKPMLVFCVILIFIPSISTRFAHMKLFKNLEEELSPMRRELAAYEASLIDKKYFKETRILGIFQQQFEKYEDKLRAINHLKYMACRRKTLIDAGLKLITIAGYGAIMAMLFVFVMRGAISIGAFAAVLASLANIYRFMNKLIFERLGWALEHFGSVENSLELLMKPEKERAYPEKNSFAKITLEAVSFQYPQSESMVLQDINLKLNQGESLALVGANGSGKSTLSKIILGLYPVTKGQALIDDQDIYLADYDQKSVIFQNFSEYQMALKENTAISDLNKAGNQEEVFSALDQAGLSDLTQRLPQGINTMLGREFEGIDLSGGQWQRVAIARGLFKTHELIVLDEPTAAIDPIEERNLYREFQAICRDKTSLMITHRIGSAKMADRIIVLKAGRIVEEGSHAELVAAGGEYQKLFEEQSQWYK